VGRLLGFAKIGVRVLLARGRSASGRVTRDLPEAVRGFRGFVLPARQVLFVNALGHQLLPKLLLSLVLSISGWLALRFGFTKARQNYFAFFLLFAARRQRQRKKDNDCETFHLTPSNHKSGSMVCWA
jgi:hypothetical protein